MVHKTKSRKVLIGNQGRINSKFKTLTNPWLELENEVNHRTCVWHTNGEDIARVPGETCHISASYQANYAQIKAAHFSAC